MEYRIAVQCTCLDTWKTATFIREADSRKTVSPLFTSLAELYPWMKANGWQSAEYIGSTFVPWRVVNYADTLPMEAQG